MSLEFSEILLQSESIKERITTLNRFLDIDNARSQADILEHSMSDNKFWDNHEKAHQIINELNLLKKKINSITNINNKLLDLDIALEILETDKENKEYLTEASEIIHTLIKLLEELEIVSYLSGKHDKCNALLSIHAGAGGTESCDWADMLLRMYIRWTERKGFAYNIQDIQPGEEAGISRVTIRIAGEYAYGYTKSERGVHRLVRISPFDANKRRHTSFCSVDVIAEIEDDNSIQIPDDEIRIDTYRSSGKGGQHVNKTESAIRITHLPTGIIVTCQNERSQYKNKESAMRSLRSRLFERMEDEKRSTMEKFYGPKGEIGWGNQIRSYVLQPYQMVKDLRTSEETGNIQAVLDGDIDAFIHAYLKAGCPKERKYSAEN